LVVELSQAADFRFDRLKDIRLAKDDDQRLLRRVFRHLLDVGEGREIGKTEQTGKPLRSRPGKHVTKLSRGGWSAGKRGKRGRREDRGGEGGQRDCGKAGPNKETPAPLRASGTGFHA